MIRLLPVALAALAISGCASVGVYWYKEGATQEDLELAQKTCGRQSTDYNFVETDRSSLNSDLYGGAERRTDSSGGSVYRECMERSGWRRVRGEPPPRAS